MDWTPVLVAFIGAIQVVFLAVLNKRQQTIAANVDGHLDRLDAVLERATVAKDDAQLELAAKEVDDARKE